MQTQVKRFPFETQGTTTETMGTTKATFIYFLMKITNQSLERKCNQKKKKPYKKRNTRACYLPDVLLISNLQYLTHLCLPFLCSAFWTSRAVGQSDRLNASSLIKTKSVITSRANAFNVSAFLNSSWQCAQHEML